MASDPDSPQQEFVLKDRHASKFYMCPPCPQTWLSRRRRSSPLKASRPRRRGCSATPWRLPHRGQWSRPRIAHFLLLLVRKHGQSSRRRLRKGAPRENPTSHYAASCDTTQDANILAAELTVARRGSSAPGIARKMAGNTSCKAQARASRSNAAARRRTPNLGSQIEPAPTQGCSGQCLHRCVARRVGHPRGGHRRARRRRGAATPGRRRPRTAEGSAKLSACSSLCKPRTGVRALQLLERLESDRLPPTARSRFMAWAPSWGRRTGFWRAPRPPPGCIVWWTLWSLRRILRVEGR